MNTFNVSHVFHIKKSAQLYYIEEIQENVEVNKCVYNSDEYYGNWFDPWNSFSHFLLYVTQFGKTAHNAHFIILSYKPMFAKNSFFGEAAFLILGYSMITHIPFDTKNVT